MLVTHVVVNIDATTPLAAGVGDAWSDRWIARPRLAADFASSGAQLGILTGGPGSGRTVQSLAFARDLRHRIPTCWIDGRRGDDGMSERLSRFLAMPRFGRDDHEGDDPGERAVVIDDFDAIGPRLQRALLRALERRQGRLRAVVAAGSRCRFPPFTGSVRRWSEADLRLTMGELRELLERREVHVSWDEARHILRATAGRPALVVAGIEPSGVWRPDGAVTTLTHQLRALSYPAIRLLDELLEHPERAAIRHREHSRAAVELDNAGLLPSGAGTSETPIVPGLVSAAFAEDERAAAREIIDLASRQHWAGVLSRMEQAPWEHLDRVGWLADVLPAQDSEKVLSRYGAAAVAVSLMSGTPLPEGTVLSSSGTDFDEDRSVERRQVVAAWAERLGVGAGQPVADRMSTRALVAALATKLPTGDLNESELLMAARMARGRLGTDPADVPLHIALVAAVRGDVETAWRWRGPADRGGPEQMTSSGWTREAIDRSISAFLELETTGIAELPVEILVGDSAPDLIGLSAALDAQSALTLGVDDADLSRLSAARSMLRWPAMRDWLSALGTQLRLARGCDDTVAMEAGADRHPLQTVAEAQVAVRAGEAKQALTKVADAQKTAWGFSGARLEAVLVMAHARAVLGDRAASRAALEQAVAISRRAGMLRRWATAPRGLLTQNMMAVPGLAGIVGELERREIPAAFPDEVSAVPGRDLAASRPAEPGPSSSDRPGSGR